MKKTIILFSSIIFMVFSISTKAQLLKVGIGGGYSTITSESNFDDSYQYGGKLVLNLPVLPLKIAANLYNNPFSTDMDGIKYESSFFSAALGAEFVILPGPVKPYGGAELLYTSLGAVEVNGNSIGDSETKFGIGLGAGSYFTLLPLIDLDLSAHYNMNTLLSSGDNFNTFHVRLNILFNIL